MMFELNSDMNTEWKRSQLICSEISNKQAIYFEYCLIQINEDLLSISFFMTNITLHLHIRFKSVTFAKIQSPAIVN
jgi:hypothetical protein